MDEIKDVDDWHRICVLGSGSFGSVSLWKNKENDEFVAVKKCKIVLTSKQRQRWQQEVNVIKSINHPNIVRYKALPKLLESAIMKFCPDQLPLLSMEYCRHGNLRNILRQTKHCCGLTDEYEILTLFRHLCDALDYLHELNIAHRDLKPENIVLDESDRRLYKLIDLGLAKEMGVPQTVPFSGSLNYLAPEILMGDTHYTKSVDYWSLGVVMYEAVCGALPFLPTMGAVERLPYLRKKSSNHISIEQNLSGNIQYLDHLPIETHISTILKDELTQWLRLAFEFDGVDRLRKHSDDQSIVFGEVRRIVSKRILPLFCTYTLNQLSYEIDENTSFDVVYDWISANEGIGKEEIVVLSTDWISGVTYVSRSDDKPSMFIDTGEMYVLRRGHMIKSAMDNTLPKLVNLFVDSSSQNFHWKEWYPQLRKAYYYIQRTHKDLNQFRSAFEVFLLFVQKTGDKAMNILKDIHHTLTDVGLLTRLIVKARTEALTTLRNSPLYQTHLQEFSQLIDRQKLAITTFNKLLGQIEHLDRRQLAIKYLWIKLKPNLNKYNTQNLIDNSEIWLMKKREQTTPFAATEFAQFVIDIFQLRKNLFEDGKLDKFFRAAWIAVTDLEVLIKWMKSFHNQCDDLYDAIKTNEQQRVTLLASLQRRRLDDSVLVTESRRVWTDVQESMDVVLRQMADMQELQYLNVS